MVKLHKFYARNQVLHYALISIVYFQICNQQSFANPVCDTPNCKKLADYYKKNMNEDGDPCTDFYDYVCHNWGTQNPRPKYTSVWNVKHLLEERVSNNLKEILEDTRMTSGTTLDNAKSLYRACINLPSMERVDATTIKTIMQSVGNWPMFTKTESNVPWWQIDSQYISKTGQSSILDYRLISQIRSNGEIIVLISALHSPYGMLKTFAPLRGEQKKQYKEFLTNVIKSIAPTGTIYSADIIDKDLESVIEFRERLVEIIKTEDKNFETTMLPLDRFQEYYDKQNLQFNIEKISWLTMIRSMYKNSKNANGILSTTKIAAQLSYFFYLFKVLGKTDQRTIENHIHLYFAEKHLKLNAQMEKNLANSFIEGADATGEIIYLPEKWMSCVDNHNMPVTLGREYIKSHFSIENRNEVQDLLRQEIEFLKKQILESLWLDTDHKNQFINKANTFNGQIGFPDWYVKNGSTIQSGLPDCSPITTDVYYVQKLKKVHVSAAYLQWPIFMTNMPYEIKHGAIGFILAHELYHGFDHMGLNFDAFGNKKKWLPLVVYSRFDEQAECFKVKYKNYKKDELDKRHITKTPKVNTIDEDIADGMGLKLAYLAYKQQFTKSKRVCPTLPGFQKFDCDKLFFIAFANIFCANSSRTIEEKILLSDDHSFPQTRVNGAVGNMEEFHAAFRCKPNDHIAPKRLCNIWK